MLNDLILSRPFFSFRKDIGDSIARNRFGEVRSSERNIISRKCLYLYGIESRKKTKNSRFSQTYRAIDQISPLFDFIKNKFVLHICLRHAIVFSNINTLSPTIRSTSDKRQAIDLDSIDLDYDQIHIVHGYRYGANRLSEKVTGLTVTSTDDLCELLQNLVGSILKN